MSDPKTPPPGWQAVPPNALRDNVFAVTPRPFWPHLCLEWRDERYVLVVYDEHPGETGQPLLTLELATLIAAEAEFGFEERDRQGTRHAEWVRASNQELEAKAAALQELSQRLLAKHKRLELVARNDGGTP